MVMVKVVYFLGFSGGFRGRKRELGNRDLRFALGLEGVTRSLTF